MKINIDRLKADIEELSQIGRTPEGGVSRLSFGPADMAGREWFINKLNEIGLEVTVDAAGNIFGRTEGEGPSVMSGSHLDTIDNGGFYDGALGVLATLECLRTIKEQGVELRSPLEIVDFSDEEEWFYGFLGSYALTDNLDHIDLEKVTNEKGQPLREAMDDIGLDLSRIKEAIRPKSDFKAFLELHIEQGPLLEERGESVGVVDDVKGNYRYGITLTGKRNHAGSPKAGRRDPMRGAVQLINYMFDRYEEIDSPDVLMTVGDIKSDPSIETVIPGSIYFSIDFRTREKDVLVKLSDILKKEAKQLAEDSNLDLDIKELLIVDPVLFDEEVLDAVRQSANELDLKWSPMSSGAGHDAQVLGAYVPSAMIFVPSRAGRSHCPEEYTAIEHIEAGANVLLNAMIKLAK